MHCAELQCTGRRWEIHSWTPAQDANILPIGSFYPMKKLIEVEEAKALMTEGQQWSIWRWLIEKRRVRAVADRGTEALDRAEELVKAEWGEDLKAAYAELEAEDSADGDAKAKRKLAKAREAAQHIDPALKAVVKRVKEADDIAYTARWDAEDTFDLAEKRLSAGLAKEGARKAIEAYNVRESAIRKAEAAMRVKTP